MKKLIFVILLPLIFVSSNSQSIRKPWTELTSAERQAYVMGNKSNIERNF
jgi:hypothetical protein